MSLDASNPPNSLILPSQNSITHTKIPPKPFPVRRKTSFSNSLPPGGFSYLQRNSATTGSGSKKISKNFRDKASNKVEKKGKTLSPSTKGEKVFEFKKREKGHSLELQHVSRQKETVKEDRFVDDLNKRVQRYAKEMVEGKKKKGDVEKSFEKFLQKTSRLSSTKQALENFKITTNGSIESILKASIQKQEKQALAKEISALGAELDIRAAKKILFSPFFKVIVESCMQKKFCSENIAFLESVKAFKSDPNSDKAEVIFNTYIKDTYKKDEDKEWKNHFPFPGEPLEEDSGPTINLSGPVRGKINEYFTNNEQEEGINEREKKVNPGIFDEAYDVILELSQEVLRDLWATGDLKSALLEALR